MNRACREYASARPTGTPLDDFRLLNAFETAAKSLYAASGFAWRAAILQTPEDVESNLQELDEILRAVGKLPAMWVNFSFDPSQQTAADFAAIEQEFGLVLLGDAVQASRDP